MCDLSQEVAQPVVEGMRGHRPAVAHLGPLAKGPVLPGALTGLMALTSLKAMPSECHSCPVSWLDPKQAGRYSKPGHVYIFYIYSPQ